MIGNAIIALFLQQVREPLRPPPPIFDLVLAIVFGYAGWRVWKRGRGWRSGALVLFLFAIGGLYTFSRSF